MSLRWVMLTALAACSTGCSPMFFHYPNFRHPGTAPKQRNAAEYFDPYPLPDLGPEVDGGRPREFDVPHDPVRRETEYAESIRAGAVPVLPNFTPPATYAPPLSVPYGGLPAAQAPTRSPSRVRY